ncbi:hypothetical protein ZWY2020_021865 [Hordeum vulgare]|nr:hypothetical protein ZWY2020_021865 [Hordeum vulgare]
MQDRIEDFVRHMSDLLRIERDAELEFTQEELNATTMLDNNSKPSKPVEYLVTHGQAQQEQCDTICNLSVISSSTGLGGLHLVLFRIEGEHKLPPTTLSPGDMRNLEALMLLQRNGLLKSNASIDVVATLFGGSKDVMKMEQNCLIDWGESSLPDPRLSESWASKEMYQGLLQSSHSVASHLLADSPVVKDTWITRCPLLLLDTRMPYGILNADCVEHLDPAGTGSFYNNGEADIVTQHVLNLVHCGVSPSEIAIQSPYIAQVQLLREKIEEYPGLSGVEVSTVDSFQGREADAVVLSMVQSNPLGR